jgi:hypothetical protein
MTEETQAAESQSAMACPKDGTSMAPLGRRGRGGAYRCPECKGMFLDVETMRRRRAGGPPMWAPVVMSVLMSVGMTLLVRRLRHRPKA